MSTPLEGEPVRFEDIDEDIPGEDALSSEVLGALKEWAENLPVNHGVVQKDFKLSFRHPQDVWTRATFTQSDKVLAFVPKGDDMIADGVRIEDPNKEWFFEVGKVTGAECWILASDGSEFVDMNSNPYARHYYYKDLVVDKNREILSSVISKIPFDDVTKSRLELSFGLPQTTPQPVAA